MAKKTEGKNNTMRNYIIAAVAIIIVILLIVYGRNAGTEEAPAAAPEEAAPAAPEEVPPEPEAPAEAAPVEETPTEGEAEEVRVEVPSEVEIVEQYIATKESATAQLQKVMDESWFGGINCHYMEEATGEVPLLLKEEQTEIELETTEKKDTLDFTLVNNAPTALQLTYPEFGSENYFDSMRVQVNGRRVRDIVDMCGGVEIMEPGQVIECKGVRTKLKSGTTYSGKELVNSVSVEGSGFKSKVVFKC